MKSGSNLEKVLAAGHFAVTGECGPPRGADADAVRKKVALLKGWVDAVNVTDNQTAMVRMSSFAAALIVKQEGLEPVMQMVARDRNRIAMQSDILGAAALGIANLVCLSGDHQKFGDHPQAKNVYDIDSIQMIDMVRRMRDEGFFLGGQEISMPPKMFIGAAASPFAHPLAIRVPRLGKKVAAGADFIQTQVIYNVKRFKEWMREVVDRGLHKRVKILAGVTPFKSFGMARYMATNVAGIEVPKELLDRMKAAGKEKAREEGLQIAHETIEELRGIEGVAGVHIMAIEWEEAVSVIVQRAGLSPRPIIE